MDSRMTRKSKTGVVLGGAVALAFGAYSVGSQVGDGSAGARSSGKGSQALANDPAGAPPGPPGFVGGPPRGGNAPGPPSGARLDDLATKLGVDSTALRQALDAVRKQLQPDGDPRAHLAAALAKALGMPVADVTAALDKVGPPKPADAQGFRRMRLHADGPAGHQGFRRMRLRADGPPGPHHGPPIDALAKALGVDKARLRSAFDQIRSDRSSEMNARHDAFVAALAKQLGIDESKVKAVLPTPPGQGGPQH